MTPEQLEQQHTRFLQQNWLPTIKELNANIDDLKEKVLKLESHTHSDTVEKLKELYARLKEMEKEPGPKTTQGIEVKEVRKKSFWDIFK